MVEGSPPSRTLRRLTAKQRAVLDLLILHKTSKEIARDLEISHYTVDQRITAARKKLGVTSRNELAVAYRKIRDASQKLSHKAAYQSPHVELPAGHRDEVSGASGNLDRSPDDPGSINSESGVLTEINFRVAPEIIEGRYGVYFRLAAMGLLTIMMLVIALGGLAAFGQLSDLMS